MIPIQVDRGTCGSCGERRMWTNAAADPRTRKRRPQAQHEALHAARTRQETKDFMQRYQRRAGIEGMISQGVHGFDLRYARYRGLAKTALQHSFVALALNLTRLIAWLAERPKAQTRPSRFAAAFQHAGMAPLPVSCTPTDAIRQQHPLATRLHNLRRIAIAWLTRLTWPLLWLLDDHNRRYLAPEPFEAIVVTLGCAEDMRDNVAIVKDDPTCFG